MDNKYVFDNLKDFDPVHTFECGQVFRWHKEDTSDKCSINGSDAEGESNILSRYIGAAGLYAAEAVWDGSALSITANGGSREFWHDYFDLDTDYGLIKNELINKEPRIKDACEYGYGIRILKQDLFETIISFIISQNNNIPRIKKCIESICEKYGEPVQSLSEALFVNENGRVLCSFPKPETLAKADPQDLGELKLGYRSRYIIDAACSYIQDGPPGTREELLKIHGVGPKVSNCIMLFGMGDVSSFPIDTWVRQIMSDMYGFDEQDEKGMSEFANDRFGKFAGYAQQYLFYYYRDRQIR